MPDYNGIGDEEGVSILLMGRAKIGKTTSIAYTFRNAAWITTERGGLIPVKRCLGFTPTFVWQQFDENAPLEEFDKIIDNEVIPRVQSGIIKTVVIDTLTTFTERLINQLKGGSSKSGSQIHGKQAYGAIQDIVLERVDRLRNMGIWVIMTTHVRPPEFDEKTGMKLMGGPEFPGKKLTRSLPAKMDIVLMADIEQNAITGAARRILRCDPLSPDYLMGDRFGVTQPVQDMNLAPIVWRIKRPDQPVPEELMKMKLNVLGQLPTAKAGGLVKVHS